MQNLRKKEGGEVEQQELQAGNISERCSLRSISNDSHNYSSNEQAAQASKENLKLSINRELTVVEE